MDLTSISKSDPIFVTGATGFIGSYILRYLVKEGFNHIIAIHRATSRFEMVSEVKDKVDWRIADLTNFDQIQNAMKGARYVIHAAAVVSFREEDNDLMMRHNYEGTRNVVNAALQHDVVKLVHVSSIAAISKPTTGNMIDENTGWSESAHTTPYARSKYAAEQEVRRGEKDGLAVSIINPSVVMGAGIWSNSSVIIFKSMAKGQLFYPLGANGFVDVRDVAKIAIKLLDPNHNGLRFIVSGINWSFKEMMTAMAEGYKLKPPRWPLSKWIIPISWRALAVVSWITGKPSIYTKQSVINSMQIWRYNNQRSIDLLDHDYLDLRQTIHQTCQSYVNSKKLNKDFGFLSLD